MTFNWDGTKLNSSNYDLKVLGKTTSGEIFYGYALLPEFLEDPASLVTLPLQHKDDVLITEVENFGLKESLPSKLKIIKHSNQKHEAISLFDIPVLKPYEVFKIELPVKNFDNSEYEAILITNSNEE